MSGWATQKKFGALVRAKLGLRGWTVKDLAVMVNCSPGYLYRIVRGQQEPSWSLAVNIAKAFGSMLDEFTDDFTVFIDCCAYCGRAWSDSNSKRSNR